MGKNPLNALFDISLDEELQTHFRIVDVRPQDTAVMVEILKSPHVLPGLSDAGAHIDTDINAGFPTRLLGHWVREKQYMTLEEAVHKLSSLPAQECGITDRGFLKVGLAADITIFDPQTVAGGERVFADDLPGGRRRLVQHATGIEYTVVNGAVTLHQGRASGDMGGQTLRSSRYAAKTPVP